MASSESKNQVLFITRTVVSVLECNDESIFNQLTYFEAEIILFFRKSALITVGKVLSKCVFDPQWTSEAPIVRTDLSCSIPPARYFAFHIV